MMKIVQINATCGVGSTGKICVAVSRLLNREGIENYIFYTSSQSTWKNSERFCDDSYLKRQALKSRVLGNYGFNSSLLSKKLIKRLDEIKPDIIHLHNVHSHNANLKMLIKYIKQNRIKLFWTFHDCWAFTGYCVHFQNPKCYAWKNECENCPQRKNYSWFFDKSKKLFKQKKELLQDLDLTIIAPSAWMAGVVKQSFLREHRVEIINNGINLQVFKPTKSDFRERYGLQNKYIVLGVAFGWGYQKGLDCFVELSRRLPDDYKIVLVGTNGEVDKQLPTNIVSIHRTNNQSELAEIYTVADVFVNATREDTYPTVNMEALACGTPVITFDAGGSADIVEEGCGRIVPLDDIERLINEISSLCNSAKDEELFLRTVQKYNEQEIFEKYIKLYLKKD